MSDIEEGEVVSSDDENKCNLSEDKESNITLLNENNIQINDNNRWNFEQNNIKTEKFRDSDSEENYKDDNNKHGSRDQHGKKKHKHHEYNSSKRKRRSDHFTTEEPSSCQSEVIPVKRRILCKYYAAGDCKSGSTCFFMHNDFPCKFFHDENSTCRAGDHCKFSHNPLSEEMKIVLEGFIQDGKEKINHFCNIPMANIPTFINDSFITVNTPRPNCLLPTPTNIKPMIISNYDFDYNHPYDSLNNDFNNPYESFNHIYYDEQSYPDDDYPESSQIFPKKSIFDGNIPNYPIANKSQFDQHIPEANYFDQDHRNINQFSESTYLNTAPNFQRPFYNFNNSDDDYFNSTNTCFNDSVQFSNDENIFPKIISENVNSGYKSIHNQINYKNQAPARFIVGNLSNCIKIEPEIEIPNSFDIDFQNALKKLAEQIVVDTHQDEPVEKVSPIPEVNTSYMSNNVIKTEASNVRIDENISIFKHENEMSESEKIYIQEMKSLINLDAQFENVIPWQLQKLHVVKKQPYTLFKFNIDEIHDNPLADPRLNGHPVLNYYCEKEEDLPLGGDLEDYNELITVKDEFGVDQSEDSDPYLFNNNFRQKKLFESMF